MRNVQIAYALSFFYRSWFWLGCWVFYYLRYTDYAGIGLLETIMITTSSLGEIPTGAIADVFGKKFSISAAFALGMIGNLVMAYAPNYWFLVASIITMTIGGAFYSGSLQALVYDSLKEKKEDRTYSKVIGRMTSMENLGMAIAGISGGFLYKINISLPFVAVAIAYLIGLVISFWLVEPYMDTEKYSWKKFLQQNAEGFKQLFRSKRIGYLSLLLIIPAAFMIATENVLNDATAVQLGYDSIKLGIFITIMQLFGILVSENTDKIINKIGTRLLYLLMIIMYLLTLFFMPIVGIVAGSTLLFIRFGVQTFMTNYESVRINEITDSQYRATTLSTFSLIKNIPYVITATGIGMAISLYTAKVFSFYFGLALLISLAILYFVRKPVF